MSDTMTSTSSLQRLKDGVRRFQAEVYPERRESYQYAATHPQKPHTLFITCADSRINVEDITSAGVGELFITRNVGNVVPSFRQPLEGVAAVIEYAVNALKVQGIVVCGHSDCGAMKALLKPESAASLPAVRSWLENTPGAAQGAADDPLRMTTEGNVLAQLENLKTHPAVADALAAGTLTLSGWVYDIATGQVRIAEEGSQTFVAVAAEGVATA
jgi:carbonic anhydrase